jgi:hypothetical protein
MRWYRIAQTIETRKQETAGREALRRNDLHVDLRVYVGEPTDFHNENDMISKIKSVIVASINKSLDVIGIVAKAGPEIGQRAQQVVQENGYDLWVCPGQEYYCADKITIVAYNLQKPLQQGLLYEQAAKEIRRQGGVIMAMGLSKRSASQLNKYENTELAPDCVEVANDKQGGYKDIDTSYPKFENSASTNANEMEKSFTFTVVPRKTFEKMNLLPQNEGRDYTPEYLQKDDAANPTPEMNPNAGAEAERALQDPNFGQDDYAA